MAPAKINTGRRAKPKVFRPRASSNLHTVGRLRLELFTRRTLDILRSRMDALKGNR